MKGRQREAAAAAGSGVAAIGLKSSGTSGRNHFAPLSCGNCVKKETVKGSVELSRLILKVDVNAHHLPVKITPHMLLERHVNSMFCGSVVLPAREQKKQRA
jgi:hypothetical protein